MVANIDHRSLNRLPSLFEIAEAKSESAGHANWWGPVIGSDEGNYDAITGLFATAPCLTQDEVELSDGRLKHSVSRIGRTVYGLPLYRFSYHDRAGVYEGVMAEDVLRVKPSAVTEGSDGFYRVNYRDLGLELRKVG